MIALSSVRAHAGKGLEGDRYFDRTGTYSKRVGPAHELSLIESEALEALRREAGIELEPRLSRRNLVTIGVPLNHLVGREFTIGRVVVRGMELCEPCGHMEKLSGARGARAGLVHRGGLRCAIVTGGILRVGDPIRAEGTVPSRPELDAGHADAEAASRDEGARAGLAAREADTEDADELRPEVATALGMQFCFVPAGPFILGSQADPLAWDGEAPEQTHELSYGYWMARYPVSNAQFREFADDGAYREAELWPEAAQARVWRGGLLEYPDGETARLGPLALDRRFRMPARPAAGATWYEALAFCRWLERRLSRADRLPAGWEVCLPSELEWEKAARGGLEIPHAARVAGSEAAADAWTGLVAPNRQPRRRFPWGDEPDRARANYGAAEAGTTSPLGRFPLGSSPYGVEELSGNVWEWTRSLWASYPYPSGEEGRKQRERLSPGELRTLRGGAFNSRDALVRCAARHCHSPLTCYRHVGFRACLRPAASDE
jgi:formylglycine-generating enzyme required for sulfatase activity